MKPRFLADADFNQKIVLGLLRREPAIDFQTASQGGVIGRPDPEVLSVAARENRILVSHDRGTMPAHLPVARADAFHAWGTGRSACATEARTGHGWGAVTEMLPGFVGRRELTSHA